MKKSSAIIDVVGGGEGGQRIEMKCSEEITHVWSAVVLVVEMKGFGSADFSREK